MGQAKKVGGWLSEWVSFAGEYNEAPDEFHLAVGMATLGAYLSKQGECITIGVHKSPLPLTTRLSSFLMGDSGSGKGLAMNHWGGELMNRANNRRVDHLPWLCFDQGSSEKLAEWLCNNPWGIVTADEASTLLGGQKEYNKGIATDLINALDERHQFSIKFMKRDKIIYLPRLTAIVGCNPGLMPTSISGRTAEGGLPGRFMWWFGPSRPPIPAGRQRTEQEWKGIVDGFITCSVLRGEVPFDADTGGAAFRCYETWYLQHVDTLQEAPGSARAKGWMTRWPMWLLRLAVVRRASFGVAGIEVSDIEWASALLLEMKPYFEDLMGTLDNTGKLNVRDVLKQEMHKMGGPVSPQMLFRSKVVQAACTRYDDMIRELVTLQKIGEIKGAPSAKGTIRYLLSPHTRIE